MTFRRLKIGVSVVIGEAKPHLHNLRYEAAKEALLQGQSPGNRERRKRRGAFEQLLRQRELFPVYQPIVSLKDNGVFGYEALTRLKNKSLFDGPVSLFSFAEQEGQVYALDRLARELAIDGCRRLEPQQKLFINVMAQIMEDPGFAPGKTISLLEQHHLSPHHVVFEITERSAIADYAAVKKALEHYRSQGYQIAIDDVGAGYSSLQSIAELRPDYLKIDRSIIYNIHNDEMKAYILQTLQSLGDKMDVALIAEGIEHREELEALARMGVQYAQGYLIGRPGPFPA